MCVDLYFVNGKLFTKWQFSNRNRIGNDKLDRNGLTQ